MGLEVSLQRISNENMFTQKPVPKCRAALSKIFRRWKQPQCPSSDEEVNKMWYPCNIIMASKKKMKYSIHVQHGQTYSFLRDNQSLPRNTGNYISCSNVNLVSFSCHFTLARTSSPTQNISKENMFPYFANDLSKNAFSITPFSLFVIYF